MPATRNILKHVKIETAHDRRRCHANKAHVIQPGEQHLAVYYKVPIRENICLECALPILNVAKLQLEKITKELFP